MITAVLMDDEPDALEMLQFTLGDHFSDRIKIVGRSSNFREGVLLVKEYQPDLLFLDIDLGGGKSGFDFLTEIQAAPKIPKVVFTTGYQQFAIKAVRVQAFDYLLKPVGKAEIQDLVDRFTALEPSPVNSPLQPGVIVRTTEAIYRLALDDIIYFQGNDNYTNIHLFDRPQPVLASVTLNQFEAEVMRISTQFFRVHKSSLVNLNAIERLEKSGLGRSLLLKNGDSVSISRLRYKDFKEVYLNGGSSA